jgi:hypothetical protein
MYARVTYVQAPEGKVEEGLNKWRTHVLPVTMAREGFTGTISMIDRSTGKALSLTLWDLEEDLVASTEAEYHLEAVQRFSEFFQGAHDPENFEVYFFGGPIFEDDAVEKYSKPTLEEQEQTTT